jgi:two-component system chemotaxis response regulator CheY
MKILIVDDSKTMRTIEKSVLAALGDVEIVEAADGMEALVVMANASAPFDLVLVDWNMPALDGRQFVARIRAKDTTTPLMMVTTEAGKAQVMDALKGGANGYVIKPFTADVLLERVKQVLEKKTKAA